MKKLNFTFYFILLFFIVQNNNVLAQDWPTEMPSQFDGGARFSFLHKHSEYCGSDCQATEFVEIVLYKNNTVITSEIGRVGDNPSLRATNVTNYACGNDTYWIWIRGTAQQGDIVLYEHYIELFPTVNHSLTGETSGEICINDEKMVTLTTSFFYSAYDDLDSWTDNSSLSSNNGWELNKIGDNYIVKRTSNTSAQNVTLKIRKENNCEESLNYSNNLNYSSPGVPSAPTISGENDIQEYQVYYDYTCSTVSEANTYTFGMKTQDMWDNGIVDIVHNSERSVSIKWNKDYTDTPIITWYGSNSCNDGEIAEYPVTIVRTPEKATTPTGATPICQAGANEEYTTSSEYATSYEWILSPTEAGSITGSSGIATLELNSDFSGSATLKARGINSYGVGEWSNALTINVNPLPGIPSTPTGVNEVCQDGPNTEFVTSGATNATSYTWNVTNTAGAISGDTKTGTVSWTSSFYGDAKIKVRANNSCGTSDYSAEKNVTVNPLPFKPSKPSGAIEVCQEGTDTYQVVESDEALQATSYNWEIIPAEAGTIRSNGGRDITIDWAAGYSGSLQVRVKGINSCGEGSWSNALDINMSNLPSQPEKPTGNTTPCQGGSYNYSTSGGNYADTYYFDIIPSEAGTITQIDNNCVITFNSSYSGDASIRVRGVNSCGEGVYSNELNINVQPLPGKASKPSGSIEVCQGVSETNYSTSGATNADSYDWNLVPNEAGSIVGNTIDAVVYWSSDFTGNAEISVIPNNGCGSGIESDVLNVKRNPVPVKATKPVGLEEVCQNSGEHIYNVAEIEFANEIEWRVNPVSAGQIIGSGNDITLKLDEEFYGLARLSVRGINSCGEGDWSDDLTIEVKELSTVNLGVYSVKCANGNSFELSGGSPSGGYYSMNGDIINEFDPKNEGVGNYEIVYTYTDANNCSNSDISNINVLDYPSTPEIKNSINDEGEKYVYGKADQVLKIEIESPELEYFWYDQVNFQNIIGSGAYLNSDRLPNTLENYTYWVKGYDGNCYSDARKINTKSVIKPNEPVISAKNEVCEGDLIELIAIRDNAPEEDYHYKSKWYNENMQPVFEGDTFLVEYNNEQTYYLSTVDSVNYGNGYILNESSKGSKLVNISYVENPVVNVNELYCLYDDVQLSVSNMSNDITWYDENENEVGQGSNFEVNNIQKDLTYYVQAANEMDCLSDMVSFDIKIQDVQAKFTSDVTNIELGSKVKFENQSKNAQYNKWNFGDNSDESNFENPEHYYYESGQFDVSLIIISDIECTDTVTMEKYITVTGNSTGVSNIENNMNVKIYPNPFNNKVYVENMDEKEIHIRIYDVTGNVLYHEVRKDSKIVLDFNDKKSGIYFIEMQNENNKTVKKIIKQ